MKKIKLMSITLILVIILLACSAGIDESGNKSPKETDNKTVIKTISAEIEEYSFDEALSKVDLIAEVQIENIVKEIENPIEKTIFEVKVLNILLGNIDREYIKILQHGTREVAFNDNELFEVGEKYVLFLRETIEFPEADYWIQGEEGGIYKVVDNNLVKLNGPYAELKDIQIGETLDVMQMGEADENSSPEQLINNGIQQILDKESYFELIRKIDKKGGVN